MVNFDGGALWVGVKISLELTMCFIPHLLNGSDIYLVFAGPDPTASHPKKPFCCMFQLQQTIRGPYNQCRQDVSLPHESTQYTDLDRI